MFDIAGNQIIRCERYHNDGYGYRKQKHQAGYPKFRPQVVRKLLISEVIDDPENNGMGHDTQEYDNSTDNKRALPVAIVILRKEVVYKFFKHKHDNRLWVFLQMMHDAYSKNSSICLSASKKTPLKLKQPSLIPLVPWKGKR